MKKYYFLISFIFLFNFFNNLLISDTDIGNNLYFEITETETEPDSDNDKSEYDGVVTSITNLNLPVQSVIYLIQLSTKRIPIAIFKSYQQRAPPPQ